MADNPTRRVAYVRLGGMELLRALQTAYDGIPGDARLVGVTWDGEDVALLIQGQSLEEVLAGESVPVISKHAAVAPSTEAPTKEVEPAGTDSK